jgi:hypothetical protein
MDFNSNTFWDVLLWSIMFFFWIAALTIWFRCLFDLFGDHDLGGWGKAGWCLLLVFFWFFGALIYLIARGKGMQKRSMDKLAEAQKAQAAYIQQVAGTSGANPADQIANAKSLLDAGTITPAEFEVLKSKALA